MQLAIPNSLVADPKETTTATKGSLSDHIAAEAMKLNFSRILEELESNGISVTRRRYVLTLDGIVSVTLEVAKLLICS